jgi:hypothetical protein
MLNGCLEAPESTKKSIMSLFGLASCPFIVRIWREPGETEDAPPSWRGVIEHIPSGQRRAVKDLSDIAHFIAIYLREMGIEVDP